MRQSVFEDITLADGSYSFTVSTIGDLVLAKKINLSGGSCNVGGQISNERFMAENREPCQGRTGSASA
jgi:hypothetical protein